MLIILFASLEIFFNWLEGVEVRKEISVRSEGESEEEVEAGVVWHGMGIVRFYCFDRISRTCLCTSLGFVGHRTSWSLPILGSDGLDCSTFLLLLRCCMLAFFGSCPVRVHETYVTKTVSMVKFTEAESA